MATLAAQLGPLFTLAQDPDLIIEVAPDGGGATSTPQARVYAHRLICRSSALLLSSWLELRPLPLSHGACDAVPDLHFCAA
jgi:hypothetical protein